MRSSTGDVTLRSREWSTTATGRDEAADAVVDELAEIVEQILVNGIGFNSRVVAPLLRWPGAQERGRS